MEIDLRDQVALVTGSAQRVGRSIALALAQQGMHVLVHYSRTPAEQVEATLAELRAQGVQAQAVQANLAEPEGVAATMAALQQHFGRLHLLVNSASVFPGGHLLDVTLESWDLTMNVNLRAPFLFTQAAAPLLRQHDEGGAIVNIVDQGATAPWPKRPQHGISKAALWMLTQVSAASLGPQIRVNAVCPGPVLIPPGMPEENWARMGRTLPLKRTGSGDDVAQAVIFLVRQPFVTGALLHVNGGEHLHWPRDHWHDGED